MKKLVLVLIAVMFLSGVVFAQQVQRIPAGQAKLVTMADGTNVVVILVTQNMPNGQKNVVPYAFNQSQLNTIITTTQTQSASTVAQAQALLAMFPAPTPTPTPAQ